MKQSMFFCSWVQWTIKNLLHFFMSPEGFFNSTSLPSWHRSVNLSLHTTCTQNGNVWKLLNNIPSSAGESTFSLFCAITFKTYTTCVSVSVCCRSALQQHSKLLLPQSHTKAVGKHNFCILVQWPWKAWQSCFPHSGGVLFHYQWFL